MGENTLSGYGYFPPIETTIVPHVETALLTSNSPRYRRKARSRLSPHFFVVYPLPPSSPEVVTRERPRLLAVRDAVAPQRREPLSRLGPHHYVEYPVVVPGAPITNAPVVVLAPSHLRSRRTNPRYVYPVVVFSGGALGWTAVWLARTPRPNVLPRRSLGGPIVVNP